MLRGKNVVLGVTGGIACYKACDIVSRLKKLNANVHVIMTKNSMEFVNPLTFESLANNPVSSDTFSRVKIWNIEHVSLAQLADIIVIAPATANIIGKIASGIADDMLSTTVMASKAKMLICPAMNTGMYMNSIYRENEKKLLNLGYNILSPTSGRLACGDVGTGKMVEPEVIVDEIVRQLYQQQDLIGKRVLVTCGGTQEPIDMVRVITNHSSGKMGMAIANECIARGADVSLVYGNVSVPYPIGQYKSTKVTTTSEMYDAVIKDAKDCDYVIMAAAPADYRVVNYNKSKLKDDKLTLELVKNDDIAKAVGNKKGKTKLIIFSAETENLLANAKDKLANKKADMVIANDLTKIGAGFNSDTNIVTIITAKGDVNDYGIMPKVDVAKIIVDKMKEL